MRITEIRIKLIDGAEDRLKGFCSVTFDYCFVVRDIKIINGNSGLFIAMPSRKLTAHCSRCSGKNHLKARFCNQCGARLPFERFSPLPIDRVKLYADIAHPINQRCRDNLQRSILAEYQSELERSQQPGYHSRYDDLYETNDVTVEGYESEFDVPPTSQQPDTHHGTSQEDTHISPPAPHFKKPSDAAKPKDAKRTDR
ncbi:MAG TPA: septation protein SpoVG family protein [Pirellulaceae bacterium]|nr:septation protein SpoVG family protein [Pirellulaceae bacterium]